MSLTIAPILLDKPAADAAVPSRNFTTRSAEQSADDPSFKAVLSQQEESSVAQIQTTDEASLPTHRSLSTARVDRSAAEVGVAEDSDFSFGDVLDIVNPLQHIPLVGTIYREMTGDAIKPVARVIGDVAYGALTGSLIVSGVASLASAAFEQEDGSEPLVRLANSLLGSDDAPLADNSGDAPTGGPTEPPRTEDVRLASAAAHANTPEKEKVPFGGVIALPTSPSVTTTATAPVAPVPVARVAAHGVQTFPALSALQGTRIGSTIRTEPFARPSSSVARQATIQVDAPQNIAPAKASETAAAAPSSVASSVSAQSATSAPVASDTHAELGQAFQSAAASRAAGARLPPELVRDMMQMALQRYKATQNLGAQGSIAPVSSQP